MRYELYLLPHFLNELNEDLFTYCGNQRDTVCTVLPLILYTLFLFINYISAFDFKSSMFFNLITLGYLCIL